jgi:plasmid maintenance system antidote protein VapI
VWSNLQEKYDLYRASQSEKKNEYHIIEKKVKLLAIA